MRIPSLAVIPTGCANLASVCAALEEVGARPRLLEPGEGRLAERATAVLLPGVGSFAAAMDALRRESWVDVMRNRIETGGATLAICLGLQMLGATSDEGPDCAGIGAFAATARSLDPEPPLRWPQMGWNEVVPTPGCALLRPGWAYFANGYAWTEAPPSSLAAWSEYGRPFVAAVEREAVLACQFHPELSGNWGMDLLRRWWGNALEQEVTPC